MSALAREEERAVDALTLALRASEGLLDAARAGRWDEVEALRPGRDAAIRESLSDANPHFPHALDLDAVGQLAVLDREVVRLADAARDGCRDRLREARRGGRAARAYGGR